MLLRANAKRFQIFDDHSPNHADASHIKIALVLFGLDGTILRTLTEEVVMSLIATLRRASALVVALALAAAGLAATAGPANADLLDVTCTGKQELTYSPGLLLTQNRTVTTAVTANYKHCLFGTVTSGTSAFSFTDSRGCASANITDTVRTITWNTGQPSVLNSTATVVNVGSVTILTKTGTVVSGQFAGAEFSETLVGENIEDLDDCLQEPGLTETTQRIKLIITSVL